MNTLAKTSVLAGLATIAVVVVLFLWVDRPVIAWARGLPGPWHAWAGRVSLLAHHQWLQAAVLAGLAWGGIDAYRHGWSRRSLGLVYVCLSFVVAQLVGDVLKYSIGRCRPLLWFAHAQYGFEFLRTDDLHHSFPSGHTLRIFSIMSALALLFPRRRWAYWALALLVGVSRVLALRHYPSDVAAGAFIGVMSALWTWRLMMAPGRPGRAVDR
jgi:membrane-associated phospholipid phosphatase